MKVETTPLGTSADFVSHRSCFSTQSSPGSVQIQYQTLDTNDSLGSLLPMLLDLVSIYQDGKRKITCLSLMQDQQVTAQTVGPKGMYFNSQQIFSDLGFLFSPSLSLDQQRNHSVLASSGESVSEGHGQKVRGV